MFSCAYGQLPLLQVMSCVYDGLPCNSSFLTGLVTLQGEVHFSSTKARVDKVKVKQKMREMNEVVARLRV